MWSWRSLLRRVRLLAVGAGLGCATLAAFTWLFAILPDPRSVHTQQQARYYSSGEKMIGSY